MKLTFEIGPSENRRLKRRLRNAMLRPSKHPETPKLEGNVGVLESSILNIVTFDKIEAVSMLKECKPSILNVASSENSSLEKEYGTFAKISECNALETDFFQEFSHLRCVSPVFEPANFPNAAMHRAYKLIVIPNKMMKGMLNAHRPAAKSGGKPNARASWWSLDSS